MKTISVVNLKGGVGKTVTAVNLAGILAADYGKRVLLVDSDPQGDASQYIGVVPDACSTADLFDDGSAMVRLAAFVFLCRLAESSPERSDEAWPLLDEAIQCYHGDAEYRDMLVALLGVARGSASDATRAALADRVRFDAESGAGYMKAFSAEILQALE